MPRIKKEKKIKPIKWKLRVGRLREKEYCFHVLRDGNAGVYDLLKEKISLDDLSELIYLFFDEMRLAVVEEGLGVELPLNLGYIQVSGVKETAYKVGKSPVTLNKAIVNPNYHTDGYVFKSWYRYNNTDNIIKKRVGVYQNASMYQFKACKNLKKMITDKIRAGKWKHWGRVSGSRELYTYM